jgi:ABC-type antimicrobial peptide transport system permease subunit
MSFGGKDVYIDVPVKEEAKIEVVAESVAPETIETEIAGVANVLEAEITEAAELLNTIAETKVAEATEVISEATEDTEVVAEATVEIKTERKKFQSGQIIMLVIAGISLLLGALAVFGINTRRKE